MKNIRVGMIGGGFMCKAHVNGYKTAAYMFSDLGARAELQAICVRSQEKADALAARYGFASAYADVDQMLAQGGVDLYDVCVPAELHKDVALRVMESGKTILCEKPLALYSADAKQLLFTAAGKGIEHYVGFNYRFMPAVRMAKNMLSEGVLGQPRHMRVSYFQQNGADSERPFEQLRYARTPACGSLQEIGSHAIDQMRFLIGELQTVSGITTVFTPARKTESGGVAEVVNEDMAAATITFQNGATGSLECSGAYWGKKNQLSWEIFCSEGSIFWNLENPNELGVYKKGAPAYADGITKINVTGGTYPYGAYWWPGAHNLGWEHGHVNMLAGILENMAAEQPIQPVATFLDGYRTAVIIEAIRESSQSGRRIDVLERFEA